MTKSELFNTYRNLKAGKGIVLISSRNHYLMIDEKTMFSKDGFMKFDSYDENLKYQFNNDFYEINEIWIVNLGLGINEVVNLTERVTKTLIYKRSPEVTELTLEDIAKKFEISVTSLRIKK